MIAACLALAAHAQPSRPPIVGVAHFAAKTSDLAKARQFYGHDLGFAEISALNNLALFKVNDHQYVYVLPELRDPAEDRLSHIAFETTDAKKLRDYLAAKGVAVPAALQSLPDGNLSFQVTDPDGHAIEFLQFLPGGIEAARLGQSMPESRISTRIIHVGVTVKDRTAADRFYHDILGFEETWHGGPSDDKVNWVDMRVPEGTDWLEYMLNVNNPSPRTLGVMHHFGLGVPSVADANQRLLDRGVTPGEKPKIGRDGKWQLNLYDADLTRVELMEPKPVQTPCCSPMKQP